MENTETIGMIWHPSRAFSTVIVQREDLKYPYSLFSCVEHILLILNNCDLRILLKTCWGGNFVVQEGVGVYKSKIWSFVDYCVQKVDLCFMCYQFYLYQGVVVVEDLYQLQEILHRVRPNTPDVIQVSEVLCQEFLHFCLFPICHTYACFGWSKPFAHCCTFNVEVILPVEFKVISC